MNGGEAPGILGTDAEEEARAFDEMAWAEPQFSPQQINAAGKLVASSLYAETDHWSVREWIEYDAAVHVINNWRSCHAYPLNTFQMNFGARRAASTMPLWWRSGPNGSYPSH